ncbi:hypothetical protein F5Y17DRAFT_374191 [Xylariaceae sp. FL0594]|nr:hypothetical protein F5Y17DRAFT_374191 [Xylariaceae sp. FL0594]
MDDQGHNASQKDGARMILPAHLNKLLEMFPTGQQMVVMDLRPAADYQRSHIHGAVNFRAPASFVSRASMEMIEKCLTDEASRSSFDKWYTSECVVFYDKVVEYPWECPVAEAFFRKFRGKRWPGQCFVLKGHYREFSQSFDKYIVGVNASDKAAKYLASLQDVSWEKNKEDTQRYEEWLKLLDGEDRVQTPEPPQAVKLARLQKMQQRQKVLEVEFERTFPYLHRQAQARKPDDNWVVKAPLVPHLERGIAKMQQQQEAGWTPSSPRSTTTTATAATATTGHAAATDDTGLSMKDRLKRRIKADVREGGGRDGGAHQRYTGDRDAWRPVPLPAYTPYPETETSTHVGPDMGGASTSAKSVVEAFPAARHQQQQQQTYPQDVDNWQAIAIHGGANSSSTLIQGVGVGVGDDPTTADDSAAAANGPGSGGGGGSTTTTGLTTGRGAEMMGIGFGIDDNNSSVVKAANSRRSLFTRILRSGRPDPPSS